MAKGSGEPNKNKVGKVTKKQVEEIAKQKLPDLNAYDLPAAVRIVKGTARSMGIEVVGRKFSFNKSRRVPPGELAKPAARRNPAVENAAAPMRICKCKEQVWQESGRNIRMQLHR